MHGFKTSTIAIKSKLSATNRLFSLYVLLSHFTPREAIVGNSLTHVQNVRIIYEETKGKFP